MNKQIITKQNKNKKLIDHLNSTAFAIVLREKI